jgi:hypothetical protein
MSAWGHEPWDSDDAADWFSELITAKFVKQIALALRKDPQDEYETIRAACYVLNVLGQTYIWPGDKLKPQLQAAIKSLRKVLESGVLEDRKIVSKVRKELKSLEQRLQSIRG